MRTIHFSEFEFNLDSMTLSKNGTLVAIGKRTCDSLLYLIQNRDRFISRQELHQNIWKSERISASAIPMCMLELRKILDSKNHDSALITSRRLHGYRFTGVARFETTQSPSELTHTDLPFVGREPLLKALHRSIQSILISLRGKAITIIGEAGSGKTRIINELAVQVTGRADVIITRAVPSEAELPFSIWTSVLRAAARREPANRSLKSSMARILGTLPEGKNSNNRSNLENLANRRSFLTEWTNVILSLAALRPLVLVLEDLHHADSDSLLLLDRISSEIEGAPILLIATMRPPISERNHASAMTQVLGTTSSTILAVPPLTATEIEHLMDPFIPDRAKVARQILEMSAGNAFYATSLCQLARENADTQLRTEVAKRSASEIVSRQLNDLPASCREILTFASAFGIKFSHVAVAKTLDIPASEVMELLTPAEEARVVTFDGIEYGFRHSILRDSLYLSIRQTKRLSIHHQIGSTLKVATGISATPTEVFNHLCRSYPLTSLCQLVEAALYAANEATSRFAHHEAARILSTLLDLAKKDPTLPCATLCEIMIALANAEIYSGNPLTSRRILLSAAEIARRESLPESLAMCGLSLAPDYLSIEVGTYDPDLVMILRESFDLLPDNASSLRSQVAARLSQALRWKCDDRDQIEEYARVAFHLADQSKSATAKLAALAALADAASGPDLTDERIDRTLRLQDAALSQGDKLCFLVQQTRLIAALLEKGDMRGVARENERYRDVASKTGLSQYLWYPVSTDSMLACAAGRIDLAERYANAYASIGGAEPDENFKQTFACQMILRQIEQNRSSEVLNLAKVISESHRSVLSWSAAIAWIQWDCGKLDEARESLRQFSESDMLALFREQGGTIGLAALAEVAAYVGDKRQVDFLYRLVAPISARFAIAGYGVAYFGSLERYASLLAGSLGLSTQSIAHARRAVREETRVGAPGWRMLALMDLNRSLDREKRTGKASRTKIIFPREVDLARPRRVYQERYLEGE